MKFINEHRKILFSGKRITHDGYIYWADMEKGKVYRHTVEDELAKEPGGEFIGRIAHDGTIYRTGNKFKSLRQAAGISVSELAEKTGLPKNTLVNYDLGQRKLYLARGDILYKIARFFGVSIEELIEDDILESEK